MPRDEYMDPIRMVRPLIINIFEKEGRDFTICEQCLGAIPEGKFEFHHKKYEGATIRDLDIVCHKCNMQSENKNLE